MPGHKWFDGWKPALEDARRVGLRTGDGRLVAAVIERASSGRARLTACASFEGDTAADSLIAWQRRGGYRKAANNLLLANGDYQILPIDAPPVAPEERAGAARWLIKGMIDYPADEAAVDCLMIPSDAPSSAQRKAWAVVARRSSVVAWAERWHRGGLNLACVDIPELALRNLAALTPPDGACALLHIGPHASTLVMVWQGELCSTRRFEIGADQFDLADAQRLAFSVERLGLEVQRSADAFERQFHSFALGRLWVTPTVAGVDLAAALGAQLNLRVQTFQLEDWLDVGVDAEILAAGCGIDWWPAIGAALRSEMS